MIDNLIKRYPGLASVRPSVEKATDLLFDCYKKGGKILLCGNGGSAADCDHIAGELLKGFLLKRRMPNDDLGRITAAFPDDAEGFKNTLQRGIAAISLPAQSAVISAYNNDVDADMVYAQLVYAYRSAGDVVLGISTSGNSKNVINALKLAKAMGMVTVGFCGASPCLMDGLCDAVIKAPETETYKIQEYHLAIYHAICAELEKRAFE